MAKGKSSKKKKTQRAIEHSFKDERVEASSGNVFADLGLPHAEELLVRSALAVNLRELIEQKGWTQREAARRAHVDQPKLANLMRGRLSGYSAERLIAILNRFGHSVEVRISANITTNENAHTHVTVV